MNKKSHLFHHIILGCCLGWTSGFAKPVKESSLPSITSEVEKEEIYDFPFSIVESEKSGKYSVITGKGLYKGKVVGLKFKIEGRWNRAKKDELISESGSIYLESIGKESDALISALNEIYKYNVKVSAFQNSGALPAFAMGGTRKSIEDGSVNFKVFSDSEAEGEYFEFFITYAPKEKRIWIGEKDESYRPVLFKRLARIE